MVRPGYMHLPSASAASTEEAHRKTLTELAEALLKAPERLEPEGLVKGHGGVKGRCYTSRDDSQTTAM